MKFLAIGAVSAPTCDPYGSHETCESNEWSHGGGVNRVCKNSEKNQKFQNDVQLHSSFDRFGVSCYISSVQLV